MFINYIIKIYLLFKLSFIITISPIMPNAIPAPNARYAKINDFGGEYVVVSLPSEWVRYDKSEYWGLELTADNVSSTGLTLLFNQSGGDPKGDLQTGSYYWLNSFGSTGHTDFKGIKLWSLLEDMGIVDASSSRVKIVAADGYSMDFGISQIKRMDYIDETNQDVKLPIIIAWEENGGAYDPADGAPFKLVVGQKEPGDVNKPQWVSSIEKIIVE